MSGAVGAEQAGVGQGAGIAPVGLHVAGARRIHGGEARVGDDDLVAEGLETAGDPFALGRGLDQDPGAMPGTERGGEALGLGADALLDDLTALGEDVDLAFLLCTSMPSLKARAVSSRKIEGLGLGGGLSPW